MSSVGFETDFQIGGSSYYWPSLAATPPDETGSPPSLPQPLNWNPAPSLDLAPDGTEYLLSFTEPPGWSRGPWHIPATASGYYVPSVLEPSNRAWIGEGPSRWAYSVDGMFRNANLSPGPPGTRTVIPLSGTAPAGVDLTQPHTFKLLLLWQDVPAYQWWLWNGKYAIAPANTYVSPYWFFPQDRFRATNFPDGYPFTEPVQPVLPPGLTALDYGGLGPTQVGHSVLQEGDEMSSVFMFQHMSEPGVWLELTSDPFVLSAAPTVTSSPPTTSVRTTSSTPTGSATGSLPSVAGPSTTPTTTRTLAAVTATQINYTHADLEQLWLLAGGSAASADVAAAIAQAESGGCLYAKHGPTDDRPVKTCVYTFSTGENSYGLWQINRQTWTQYSAATLYTPLGNAGAAVAISRGGTNFNDWTTYTNGAYKQYLTTSGAGAPPPPDAGTRPSLPAFDALTHALGHDLPLALSKARRARRATRIRG